jgi:hypothetical protein
MADIQKYLDLVTSQHYDKPKFMAWLTAALSIMDDIASLASNINSFFDLDTAIGAQQDVIGVIVGVGRVVNFQPSDSSSPVLDNDTYRLMQRAKIANNQWDGTMQQIYDLWSNLFPSQPLVLVDNQDMSMNALMFNVDAGIQQDLVSNGYVVPKPQGVRVNYAFPQHPVFSYGLDTDLFKGYGEGYWTPFV